MKARLILFLLLGVATLQAQNVIVSQTTRLPVQHLFFPTFNNQGTDLLLTTQNYQGLVLVDIATMNVQTLTDEMNAGYEPIFSADDKHVIYRSESVEQGKRYIDVKAINIASKQKTVMMAKQRNLAQLQSYGNGFIVSENRRLMKATFGQELSSVPSYVCSEDLKLVLYRAGKRQELAPVGSDVSAYIWSSLSPDGSRILFHAAGKGTYVCDLDGNIIASLGSLNAPVWYNNSWVVGMNDTDDGHQITASEVLICSLDGKVRQKLSSSNEIALFPTASEAAGKIAYCTFDGNIVLLDIVIR